jgi:glycosyltransferase involved in cell wall biosynthesis
VPSIREGLSLTTLEAMAAGKAIVATRTGGITELVSHEETALLVQPADGEGLATAIGRLLRDPALAAELAARASAHSKHFSIEQNVKQLEELYAWLIGGNDVQSFARVRHAA